MDAAVPELLAFAGIMALGQFSPGPDMLLLTRTSLAEGGRAGVATALGIATGLSIYGGLSVGGMAVVLDKAPALRQAMMWVAAAYLLWLGYKLVRACFETFSRKGETVQGALAIRGNPYVRGLLCNLLNPKVMVFLAAVVAPFLRGDHPDWWPKALWGVIAIQGGTLWALWALLLQWRPLRDGYKKAQPVIDGLFGIGLVALAVKLVIQ
ncbi:MAG: LysE family transporter [Luteolibacter sp.]